MEPELAQADARRRDIRSRFGIPAIILTSLMIGTCSRMPGAWEQVRLQGYLTVVTRNSPLAYYEGAAGPEGPEYELALGFARRLGVELDIRFAPTGAAALEELRRNRAQIAAAGIIATEAHGGSGAVRARVPAH